MNRNGKFVNNLFVNLSIYLYYITEEPVSLNYWAEK